MKNQLNAANSRLLDVTRKNEDADRYVTIVQDNPEFANDELELVNKELRNAIYLEANAKRNAQRIKDSGADQSQVDQANKKHSEAISKKEEIQAKFNRHKEKTLSQAKRVAMDESRNVTTATRSQEDAQKKYDEVMSSATDKLDKANKKVKDLEDVRKIFNDSGTQLLVRQPQYTDTDIYKSKRFSDEKDVSNHRVTRFRLVGFPEFSSISITQGDLSALIPAGALFFNLTNSNIDNVVVKVPIAESYAISIHSLLKKLFGTSLTEAPNIQIRENVDIYKAIISSLYQTGLYDLMENCDNSEGDDDKKRNNSVYLRVISEVFYTRAIDVTIFSAASSGVLFQLARQDDESVVENRVQEGDTNIVTSELFAGPESSQMPDDDSYGQIQSTLQTNLEHTHRVPGGSVQIVSSSSTSVGLRMVYDRPIAIGFRGLTLEIKFEKGECGKCIPKLAGILISGSEVPLI